MRKSAGVAAMLLLLAAARANDQIGATTFDSYVAPKGVFLNVLRPGGAAANAGLASGDVITRIDGVPVKSAAALDKALARHRNGDKVRLDVVHLGKPGRFTLVLGGAAAAKQPVAHAATRALPHYANVHWMRYADPAENAFSIEAPAGWRVSGGSHRISEPDVRLGVEMTSPDGAITLFYGDASIPVFSTPSAMLEMAGLHQGMVYDLGLGTSTLIEPYESGTAFAAGWGRKRIAQICGTAMLVGHRRRADSSRAIDRAYAAAGILRSVEAGEASFRCGSERGGYVFASTELMRSQMGAMWDVNAVMGVVAPDARAGEAYALLAHVAQSFAINPAWLTRERQMDRHFGQIVSETNAAVAARIAANGRAADEISDMIVKGGAARSDATARAIAHYDAFAVRGTSDYTDGSGRLYTNVDNEHAHVYVNQATGAVVPSDSENAPGAGWTEVHRVPEGQ